MSNHVRAQEGALGTDRFHNQVRNLELPVYQQQVESQRRSPYMDFPKHVHIETLALCNADCGFCPYSSLERKGTRMPDELLAKIINDLADIPRLVPFNISPFKVNEPFLDKRLFGLLQTIEARLPHAKITLTTNASPLTEDHLNRLASLQNLGYLWISFNDHRPVEYEATMHLPYQRTIARLQMIHRKQAAGAFKTPVILSRVGDGTAADQEFARWVGAHFPGFRYFIFQRGGWLGQVAVQLGPVPSVGCTRWFELSITSTGIVAHCCMDGQAAYPIGDANKQHVLDIYNQPHYRELRERRATRLEAEPCNRCTFL